MSRSLLRAGVEFLPPVARPSIRIRQSRSAAGLALWIPPLAGVLLLELTLRLLGLGPPARTIEPDPVLGWRNVPGAEKGLSRAGRTVSVRFDRLGLRDDDPPIPPAAPSERRVLVLGDGLVVGAGVD